MGRRVISRILLANSDINRLEEVDAAMTSCVGDLAVSLQVSGLELQRATYDEVVKGNREIADKIAALGGPEVRHWGR